MNLSLLVGGVGAVMSFLIVYQNYIQNAETEREREHDLRDKLLGKGWKGDQFSVSITDIRVHEKKSFWYTLRRLVTRVLKADTQVTLKSNFELTDGEVESLESDIESEYGFDASIMYSEPEEQYQIILGTIHESVIIECIGDIHLTVDKKLKEGSWTKVKDS